MNISDCRNLPAQTRLAQRAPALQVKPQATSEPQDTYESSDGWVSAGFSLAGGLVSMAGALTNQPMLKAAGILTTGVATGFTAWRVQANGAMDSAAMVSLAGGGILCAASLLTAAPSVGANHGPASLLVERLGLRGL